MKTKSPPSLNEVYHTCKDHTVSGKEFKLIYDPQTEMLVTTPSPQEDELPAYYQSPNYISHTDSKKTFTDKLYQKVKKYMLVKKLKWIEKKVPQKGRILDIGAGTGDFLFEAKSRGWRINGIEPSEAARKKASEKDVKLSLDATNFKSEKFDVITLWHVLEHVPDLRSQIIEIEHLLKKNGLLIIAVPNFRSYDAQYYQEYWAAFDVPRHLWHFSQNSFRHLLAGTSFKQTDLKPLFFDSFYVSLLSEKYKTGKTNFLRAIYTGLKSNYKARFSSEYSSLAYFFRKLG